MSLTTSDRLEVIHDSAVPVTLPAAGATTAPSEAAGAAGPEAVTSSRPTFTITDAATACSVSRKTITRKLPELAGHGAAKDDDGVWRIPVEALLAVGLHPGRSVPGVAAAARPAAPAPIAARPTDHDTVTIPRDRWDDVRIRLARAEAEAAERGLALADARLALRALTAGPAASSPPAADPPSYPRDVAAASIAHALESPGAAQTQDHSPIPAVVALGNDPVPGVGRSEIAGGAPGTVTSSPSGPGSPGPGGEAVPADVVAARNLAARTGGYVPAGAAPSKKRRWWKSH